MDVAGQFTAGFSGKKLNITCPTDTSFRAAQRELHAIGVNFDAFALKEEMKIKAILRGLSTTTNIEAIKGELVSKGFLPTYVSTLYGADRD